MKSTLFILCCCAGSCFGQPGFNQYFDFGGRSTAALNMLVDNDTLVLYGLSLSQLPQYQWGVVFAKVDTFGNIISQNIVYDTAGGHFASIENAGIKKLNDNSGYVLAGSLYGKSAGFFMQFDRVGNLVNYREYPDNNTRVDWYRKIIEVETGFLIFGFKQKLDYYIDAFVLKVDKQGNKIWEKNYELPGYEHLLQSVLQKNQNTFVIGSTRTKKHPAVGSKSRIWAIDSLGQVLWQWENNSFTDEATVRGLNQTSDGSWIYYATQLFDITTYTKAKTKIVKRDSSFMLQWQRFVSPVAYKATNYAIDIKPTPDNNYIALGTWTQEEAGGLEHQGGSLYKFSENGDSIWSRLDTALFDHYGYDQNEYSGLGLLSSGSVVAFGHAIQDFPGIGGLYGWLVKVSADGCIDTLLCTSTSSSAPPVLAPHRLRLYPNPVQDYLFFEQEGGLVRQIEIYDLLGSLVLRQVKPPNPLDVSALKPGSYFLKIQTFDGRLSQGGIVKM